MVVCNVFKTEFISARQRLSSSNAVISLTVLRSCCPKIDCASSAFYKHGFPSRLIHRAAAQRLANELAGTTGCAPVNKPLSLGGDEAVRRSGAGVF